jgi:hypothetical protein
MNILKEIWDCIGIRNLSKAESPDNSWHSLVSSSPRLTTSGLLPPLRQTARTNGTIVAVHAYLPASSSASESSQSLILVERPKKSSKGKRMDILLSLPDAAWQSSPFSQRITAVFSPASSNFEALRTTLNLS